jgi:hypothetical protein
MTTAALITLIVASGTWAGAILFQSAIVAPSVFSVLDETAARRFLRTLFPRFFRFGLGLSLAATAAAIVAGSAADWPSHSVFIAAAAALMAVFAATALGMIPAINAARDAGDAGDAGADRFAALHRANVGLTVAMLLAALVILCAVGVAATGGA